MTVPAERASSATAQRESANETVRFSVLGPVRAWRAGSELPLGPKQQRLILAILLARAGRPVSMGEFVDLLWDGRPPASAANAVHRYVGVLRRLLEPCLRSRSPGRWLIRQGGGYLLQVDADSLDLLDFRKQVEEARRAVKADEPAAALRLLITALGLWQGRCAEGLEPASSTHPAFVMLEHEYSSVVCEAAESALRCGRAKDVLPALRQAAGRNPLDEALQAKHLLVLAAEGKQAEAVALYQEIRLRLADELGVDPSAELRAAYDKVLRQQAARDDPAERTDCSGSARPVGAATPYGTRPVPLIRPAQLPPDLPYFTGRAKALETGLPREHRGTLRVLAIDGIPGIGKTALALHVAHRVAAEFPDGQLYADLRGFGPACVTSDSNDVLHGFLDALGVSPQHIPASTDMRSALYRSVLAGRRVLVVLDNARDMEQVRPLLPGTPDCMVVVTSRSRLTGLAAANGASLLTLEVPSPREALSYFAKRIGESRTAGEIDAVKQIIERCGRLPLALAIVATRAVSHPEYPLSRVAAELRDSSESLDGFSDDNLENDVRSVFSWSYRMLSAEAARIFRLLPLHTGPDITIEAMAGLAGVSPSAARDAAGELVRTRLVTASGRDRFWSHDLIRAYAAELNRDMDRHTWSSGRSSGRTSVRSDVVASGISATRSA
ncbi:NB-ARC domain-containing protein [Actinoallomurus purpureus]|uniref:AfsR/SARP family transcriptional regulator n=1 Tax=Actinoallomurus purpureus TaxID=478114 RepID=UPI002093BF8C|nr:BTAD domain-containing putative transcriptional regulator [Actinoallomurus purpureus]MCO6004198.1 NB-ARC domain-containing protein [Actinoallomurus purpureus]